MQIIHGFHLGNIKGDLFGGLTAAVVALPLALAFGVASGAGPMAGLYGAIFTGLFAALFGGTPSQITGPTGPMTVVMAAVFTSYADSPAMAFTIVMMGGGFQILFGVFRLGQLVSYVPYTVISGFMSGIGCIIFLLQMAPLIGHTPPPGGVVGSLLALPEFIQDINTHALVVGVASFVIVTFFKGRVAQFIPPPLLALAVGIGLVVMWFDQAPVLGDIPTGLPTPVMPVIGLDALPSMIGSAMILALLGSIDSLLTSLIADSVTGTEHKPNRELIGQGIGNMVAGLFGGIPGAGATMRTVVNVRSGGATPISGVVHALVLLGVVLGLGTYAAYIPHAVLAGILLKVGIDIIDWPYLQKLKRAPREGVFVMLMVLGLTVFVDLILAVGAGMVLASLLFVKRMADFQLRAVRRHGKLDEGTSLPLTVDQQDFLEVNADLVTYYHFGGPVTFGVAKDIPRLLTLDQNVRLLILDLKDVPFVDTTGAFAIEKIIQKAKKLDLTVITICRDPSVEAVLTSLDVTNRMKRENQINSREEAFSKAAAFVAEIAKTSGN